MLTVLFVAVIVILQKCGVQGDEALFAVMGGSQCAETLSYGPLSITTGGTIDGSHPYYLSTSSDGAEIPHHEWTQLVTSDGFTELFRIYWTFSSDKTIPNRLVDASNSGEAVHYRVVEADTGTEHEYDGVWWFSSTANLSLSSFERQYTTAGLSNNDGAWGAGSGTINGNVCLTPSTNFWGIGNFRGSDSPDCSKIYLNGFQDNGSSNTVKTFMYYNVAVARVPVPTAPLTVPRTAAITKASPVHVSTSAIDDPTVEPTFYPTVDPTFRPSCVPTFRPSRAPTPAPSFRPTAGPTPGIAASTARPSARLSARPSTAHSPTSTDSPAVDDGKYLFAVVGGDACAEDLHFGPQAITKLGSADGLYPNYFSTNTVAKEVAHKYWLQVVTSDGETEIFRIYWTFESAKTLRDRFTSAVLDGEYVSYRVVMPGNWQDVEYTYGAYWYFSTTSGINTNTFDVGVTSCCFSANAGAWGGGSDYVSGDLVDSVGSADFWGVGNFDGDESSSCSLVYREGVSENLGPAMKSFMYYSMDNFMELPLNFKFYVIQTMAGIDYATYLPIAEQFNELFALTVEQTVLGVSPGDVQDVTVTGTIVSRRLSISTAVTALYHHGTMATEGVAVSYTIYNYDAGASLDNIKRNLEYTIVNGIFDEALREAAVTSGVTEMANLQSATLDTTVPGEYQNTDDGSGQQQTAGGNLLSGIFTETVIIGISVGAGGFLVLIAFSCVMAHYSRSDDDEDLDYIAGELGGGMQKSRSRSAFHNESVAQAPVAETLMSAFTLPWSARAALGSTQPVGTDVPGDDILAAGIDPHDHTAPHDSPLFLEMSNRLTHNETEIDEESGSPSKPAAPTSPHSLRYSSPSAKVVTEANRWGFPMSFDLRRETTTTNLAAGEFIVAEYRWNAHVLSFKEWLLCFATFGYYYFLTRCVIRRNHRYSVLVTNLRVMTKEEFYQMKGCGWVYVEKAVENQTSFKLSELSYIMSEKRGATLLGWKPSIVNLEIHFGEFPVSPSSSGVRKVSDVIDQINAANDTINQLMGYAQDASSIVSDYAQWLWELTKEILFTPAETLGEANRNGDGNAQILKVSVELVQDPEAFEQLQKIVQAIIDHLPARNLTPEVTTEEDLRASLITVDKTTAINAGQGATYGSDKAGAFTVNTHLLYLHPTERVKDVCPNNYIFSCQHLLYMYATLGLYYVMLWDLVTYSTSYMVTDRRIIKHSLRLSKVDRKLLHHRLDMWFPDEAAGSYVVNQGNDVRGCAKGTTELSVETDKKGTLNIVVNSYEFALKLAGHLTANLPRRTDHVSVLPQETYQSARMTRRGLLSRLALLPDEHVDACENAYLRNSACCKALTCGLRKVLKTTLTTTDRGVYVESYQQNIKGFYGRTLVFYAWEQVWGAYWENSYYKKSQCLDCNCAYHYFNQCYWYKPNPIRSCHLRINVEGKTTFEFGIEMFDRVYGVQNGEDMEREEIAEPPTAGDCECAENEQCTPQSGKATGSEDNIYTMGATKSAKIKTTRKTTQVDALVDSMALGIATSGVTDA